MIDIKFEKYIEELVKDFNTATIEYHIEKPIIANGFRYEMDKQFDNEMVIHFSFDISLQNNSDEIIKFINILNQYCNSNNNYYWIEHYGEEIMKDYDELIIWWGRNND